MTTDETMKFIQKEADKLNNIADLVWKYRDEDMHQYLKNSISAVLGLVYSMGAYGDSGRCSCDNKCKCLLAATESVLWLQRILIETENKIANANDLLAQLQVALK